ncbi:TauD/TfdA family dioxygenase [Nocardia sp. CDC160]|uniref:TauD/TfdA family dioxygenase n=1 Tax=Nocardia sp. CDC160 TaxID=3112166 RepID=UPI002DB99E44|nr:TauD/TfdA family dioxygenase [Nocardia sp. CDC160]MEC3914807.1 TauD/TfdA family dioxygenase [Nocardia sp. CDC160]
MITTDDRITFDASTDISAQIIRVRSIRAMNAEDHEAFTAAFNRLGFAIVECADTTDSRNDLLLLKEHFGNHAPHPRADRDGIVGINSFNQVPGFLGAGRANHLPHTDGAFRDNPERIITLQCVTPAESGGVTFLGSAKAAFEHLAIKYPDTIDAVSRADALTIERTHQSSRSALFTRDGARLGIKFRMADGAARVRPHPDVAEMFDELCHFLTREENQVRFALRAGQVLIGDNTAIVHGRTSFEQDSARDMRRLNFDSGPAGLLLGFVPGD